MKIIGFRNDSRLRSELDKMDANMDLFAMTSVDDMGIAVFDKERPCNIIKAKDGDVALIRESGGNTFRWNVEYWAFYPGGYSHGLVFDEEMGLIDVEEWHDFIKYEEKV